MKNSRALASIIAVAASGCGYSIDDPTFESSAHGVTPAVTTQPWASGGREVISPALADACPGTQWVGYIIRGSMTCPGASNSGWRVSKLFPPSGAWAPDLDRFCVYSWRGAGAPIEAALPNVARMRLERDCRVVVPLGQPTAAAGAELAAAHRAAMGAPTFPATASPPTSRVRVAIVDGSPTETASGVPSGSGHGLAVGAVARSAGCFGAAHCPFIASHEGLRIDGGDFGYQSDVAQAMIAAIRSFLSAGTESRLIVNLSLGWDPSYGSGTGTTIRVPSYAVHTALQVAACEQVLVVAAAGNRARVDGGVGPMYPAGFEPDARRCPGTLAYSPLVHAIGGVLPDDSPLALSRATARPRLAAPASFVTAPLVGGGYADVLSGTSMAAATISGVAALVWSFDPSFSPELVMDRIHAMAVPLGAPADFEHAPWSWTVARVDACAAVAEVAPAASQPEPCSTRAAGQLLAPDFDVVFEAEVPGLRAGPPTPGFSAAATTEVMTDPDVTISPWAGPQPTKPPCPLCTANVENGVTYLYGVIEVAPGSEIISMFVRTCFDACDDGDPVYDVAGELIDGTTLKVELPEVDLANVTSLRVEAKVLDLATDEITIQASEVLAEM